MTPPRYALLIRRTAGTLAYFSVNLCIIREATRSAVNLQLHEREVVKFLDSVKV